MENKICTDCGEERDIKCFYQNGKYTRRQCNECQEERRKIYDNSEKGKATRKRYTEEHKEYIKEYKKMYGKEHHIKYYEEHKEEIKEKKHERV